MNKTTESAPLPKISKSGCIIRQLFHGRPYLVFVEHPQGEKPRCVCEMSRDGEGYKFKDGQVNWWGDSDDDAMVIAAEYLAKYKKFS